MTDGAFDCRLLNDFQRDFPLCPAPFAELAARLGVAEAAVLRVLDALRREGKVARVGAVFAPNRIGASTLAAMAVPADKLAAVAAAVNRFTFSLSVKPIIDQKCKGCHSGTQHQGGISLTNYDQIKASGASGKLLGAVNWDYGYIKMPQNASKIPDCDISKIRIWIADGMPDN